MGGFIIRAFSFVIVGCVISMAQTHAPSLHGKWVGTGNVTTCSAKSGSANVVLQLEDKGYNSTPQIKNTISVGTVSGSLKVDGKIEGVVALNDDPETGIFKSALGSNRFSPGVGSMSQSDSPFSAYWLELKPNNPGFFTRDPQTLTGTLSRKDSQCPNLQDAAVIIHVTLNKR